MWPLADVRDCYMGKFDEKGATPEGVFWNSVSAQETRFEQLVRVLNKSEHFSVIDYGCGYGALISYLEKTGFSCDYIGFDFSENMLERAIALYSDRKQCKFSSAKSGLRASDYVVASGIFNLKLDVPKEIWIKHTLDTLHHFNSLAKKGFSFNMLTVYSDADRMRQELFYADPCFFFDYCKKNFSRNVALLHDYEIYDFTLLVRK